MSPLLRFAFRSRRRDDSRNAHDETRPDSGDRSTERGAVLVLTAFIFIALLGVTALVIDIVVAHQALLRAQATADASALAAALDIDDVVAAAGKGKEYAARNYGVTDADWASCVDSEALAVATSVNCSSVDDADSPTHIRVRIPDRIVPSFFASVLGYDSFSVSATAVAEVEYVVTSGGEPWTEKRSTRR